MKLGRYKTKNWQAAYGCSRARLRGFIGGEDCNDVAASEAQLMLKAHYRGPWKMIAAITKRELASAWNHYGWPKWEWIRVKVFRRSQDEAIAAFERVNAEGDAVEEMAREL